MIELTSRLAPAPRRAIVAAPPLALPALEACLPPDVTVVARVAVRDRLPEAVAQHQPAIVVVAATCPGAADWDACFGPARLAAPQARFVWLIGDGAAPQARAYVETAARFGIFHVVPGDPVEAEALTRALTEERTWADLAPWLGVTAPTRPTATPTPPARAAGAPDATPAPVLAVALGPVPDAVRQALLTAFPAARLPGWQVAVVADTVAQLVAAAQAEGSRWTALLVSHTLGAEAELGPALAQIRRMHPALRCAVLAGPDGPETRRLIQRLAGWRIWNIAVGERVGYDALADLVTTDWPWERVQPYLDPTAEPVVTLSPPAPAGAAAAPLRDPEVVVSHVIAVVSGKGNVGKTGVVANLLVAAAPEGAVALDCDYTKPSLLLHFRPPDPEEPADLRRLLGVLELHHREDPPDQPFQLTAADRQAVRDYLQQAVVLPGGGRLVPAPSRASPVLPAVPPGVVTTLIQEARALARCVLVDTPGSTVEDAWAEAVAAADSVVLVTTPDYTGVLEAVDVVRKLDYLHVPRDRVWLVLNRAGRHGYRVEEIRQVHLPGLRWLAVLPDDPKRWEQAWRRHDPLARRHPEPWRTMVQQLLGRSDPPRQRWAFLWRRPASGVAASLRLPKEGPS